jgi:hypothetical protein
MATERIWDIQWFTGGESDDIYQWPKDSFYSAEWVEVRKNLSWATLTSALKDTGWIISWDIIYMENLETLWIWTSAWVIVCTDTGNIYLNGTLKQTLNTWTTAFNKVIGIWVMTVSWVSYVYYVSKTSSWSGQIHRSTTDLATFNVSYKTFTTVSNFSNKAIIIDAWNRLLIGINDKIIQLDNVEVVTEKLDFRNSEEVTWFTEFQNNYKIYTKSWNSWVQYFWNGTSALPDYRQIWLNQPVLWVINDWAVDYAILWYSLSYSDLYLISWSTKQELRVNLEASTTSRVLDWYLSIREWIVYISWWLSGESTNYWVYTYGNYYPWTSKSLVQQYSKSTDKITWHCHSTSSSYFACNDDKVYQIEHNNPPTASIYYNASWYIVSQMYQWIVWEEKTIKKIKVWFSLDVGSSIKIYLRKAMGWIWQLAKTIDYATYSSKKWLSIPASELVSLWLGNIWELQTKIELLPWTSGGNNTYTSTINRMTTYFDVSNSD